LDGTSAPVATKNDLQYGFFIQFNGFVTARWVGGCLCAGLGRLTRRRTVYHARSSDFWGGGAAANLMTQAIAVFFALEKVTR
jgi:hypothetical protein